MTAKIAIYRRCHAPYCEDHLKRAFLSFRFYGFAKLLMLSFKTLKIWRHYRNIQSPPKKYFVNKCLSISHFGIRYKDNFIVSVIQFTENLIH